MNNLLLFNYFFYPKANTPTSKVGDENFSNIVPKSINNSKSINTIKIIK